MDGLARRLEEADWLDGQAARTVGLRVMMDWMLLAARAYALGVGEVRVALLCANPDTPERTRLMVAAVLRNVAEGLLDLQKTQAKDRDSDPGILLLEACDRLGLPYTTITDWRRQTGEGRACNRPVRYNGDVRVQDMRASHFYNFNGVQAMPTGPGSKATGAGTTNHTRNKTSMAAARPFTGLPTRHADRNTIMTDTTNIITTGTGKEGLWPGGTFYPRPADHSRRAHLLPDQRRRQHQRLRTRRTHPLHQGRPGRGHRRRRHQDRRNRPRPERKYVHTHKIAVLTPISNEAAEYTQTTSLIQAGMVKAITGKADRLLLQGDQGDIKGLALTPDMIDAGDINEATGLTPLLDAIGKVGDNGGSPTGIIMGYGTWANLLKLNDKNNRPLIATDVDNSPTPAIYGIPIILNMQTPAGTILLNDSSQVLSAVSQAAIASSDQAYFANDSIALRVTMRLGFGVLRPNRLARLTVNKTPAK